MNTSNKNVVIIKYNAGNIQSVLFALERLNIAAIVSDDHQLIQQASHVIFPGVGSAETAMPNIIANGLDKVIQDLKQPFLGICLGMQLMCKHSAEGNTACLDIFDIEVKKFEATTPQGLQLKIPHMGWNNLTETTGTLCKHLPENSYAYFVHSYYATLSKDTAAVTHYGIPFSSMLQKDNFFGTQFHPEKSADIGQSILEKFIML